MPKTKKGKEYNAQTLFGVIYPLYLTTLYSNYLTSLSRMDAKVMVTPFTRPTNMFLMGARTFIRTLVLPPDDAGGLKRHWEESRQRGEITYKVVVGVPSPYRVDSRAYEKTVKIPKRLLKYRSPYIPYLVLRRQLDSYFSTIGSRYMGGKFASFLKHKVGDEVVEMKKTKRVYKFPVGDEVVEYEMEITTYDINNPSPHIPSGTYYSWIMRMQDILSHIPINFLRSYYPESVGEEVARDMVEVEEKRYEAIRVMTGESMNSPTSLLKVSPSIINPHGSIDYVATVFNTEIDIASLTRHIPIRLFNPDNPQDGGWVNKNWRMEKGVWRLVIYPRGVLLRFSPTTLRRPAQHILSFPPYRFYPLAGLSLWDEALEIRKALQSLIRGARELGAEILVDNTDRLLGISSPTKPVAEEMMKSFTELARHGYPRKEELLKASETAIKSGWMVRDVASILHGAYAIHSLAELLIEEESGGEAETI